MASEFTSVLCRGAKKAAGFSARLMRNLDSGIYAMPKGLDCIYSNQATQMQARHPRPQSLKIADNKLLSALRSVRTETRHEPVNLHSTQPSTSRTFTLRQHALMKNQRMERTAAFARVESELSRELSALQSSVTGSSAGQLEWAQAREAEELQEAMARLGHSKALPPPVAKPDIDATIRQR